MGVLVGNRSRERTREAAGYAIAVLGAFGVTAVLSVFSSPREFFAGAWYLLVVIVAALIGGWKAGALALGAACAGLIWGVLPPRRDLALESSADAAALAAFVAMAVIVILLVRSRDGARRLAEERSFRSEHLSQLAGDLALATGPDEVIQTSLHWCRDSLGASRTLLTLTSGVDGRGPREEWWSGGSPVDDVLRRRVDLLFDRGGTLLDEAGIIAARLAAPAGPVGVLVADLGADRPLDAEDEESLSIATATIAQAYARAQLRDRERAVAEQLQQSLLPTRLPTVPGLSMRSWFHPALGNTVAGDFLDVIVEGDRWMAIVGDACGKGVRAASAASAARHTFRAAALDGKDVATTAHLIDRAVAALQDQDMFCTAVLVEGREGDPGLRLVVAGHPRPVVVRSSGDLEEVGADGSLLGVFADARVETVSIDLATGETLVLYTDGLSDVPTGGLDVASMLHGVGPDDLDTRLAELRSPGGADDVAVLAITRLAR
ncbi:MAG: SpoIIE family protein phosphatase [Acidimicrobiales bacterium]|nr:SpoIIE family protein phosphatase [Acidimicrobiales bacterium]